MANVVCAIPRPTAVLLRKNPRSNAAQLRKTAGPMADPDKERWCIVGGGALGLTLAKRLAAAGKNVTVMEAAGHLGGLADAWKIGDVVWDRHYHVVLLSDFHLRELLGELGLGDAIKWTTTKADFYAEGRFYPLNNAVDYIKLPVLGLLGKFRLAFTMLYASRLNDGLALESIPIEDWLTKFSGKRAYERIWRPLLRAKLGENHKHASAAFIWAIIRRLYAARRSGLKTEMFGYIDGGYDRVFREFEKALARSGVRCVTDCAIKTIERKGSGISVDSSSGEEVFDQVVVTTAAPIANRICRGLDDGQRAKLDGILYQGIVCASVLLKKPLNGCYVTYITDESVPYTAVIEMTALVDKNELADHTLVYLPCYVPSDDPLFAESDEEIERRFITALLKMYPKLSLEDIAAFRIPVFEMSSR